MSNFTKWKRALLLAGKIAIGSSLAIYSAELLHLQFSSSAGIVTLLTLITTKKGTLKLSIARVITFFLAAGPDFEPGEEIPEMYLIDEGPILARALGLELEDADGAVINRFFRFGHEVG